MYPNMFKEIQEKEEKRKKDKLNKKLSFIQRLQVGVIDLKIYFAMKNGEKKLMLMSLDERLIKEFRERGFHVYETTVGCSAIFYEQLVFIKWDK